MCPHYGFWYRGAFACTLVPVFFVLGNIRLYPRSGFGTMEHPPKPPFWKPPFCEPPIFVEAGNCAEKPCVGCQFQGGGSEDPHTEGGKIAEKGP